MVAESQVILSSTYRLACVLVPKCASTTLIDLFARLHGHSSPHKARQALDLRPYAADASIADVALFGVASSRLPELRGRFSDYTWFAVVRDPHARLASNYNNKLNRFARRFRPALYLAGKARQTAGGPASWADSRSVTGYLKSRIGYREFVDTLVAAGVGWDPHYRPQTDHLALDRIDYDAILKLEELDRTLAEFLARRGVPESALRVVHAMPRHNSSPDTNAAMSAPLREQAARVSALYAGDMEALGYSASRCGAGSGPEAEPAMPDVGVDAMEQGHEPPFGRFAPSRRQQRLLALARRSPLGRGAFRPSVGRRLMGGKDHLDIAFRGGSFRIRNEGHPSELGMLLSPGYNRVELAFLLSGLPPGGTAVDLGANIGLYTIPMAVKAGPSGQAIAIDASADFLDRLAFNASASGLANVAVVHAAAGGEEGMARLEPVTDNPGTATTARDPAGDVRMRPLLSILREHGVSRLDVMKVDIDGGEEAALVPFFTEATAAELPRRLVIEHLFFDGGRLLGAMTDRNYRLLGKTRSNSLYECAA